MGYKQMKKKLVLLAVIIFAAGLVVISTKYFSAAEKKGPMPSRASVSELNKMEGVSIKKQFGKVVLTIDAGIIKPKMHMPGNFLTMILSEDTKYTLRLRHVKCHLTEQAKDLLIEGPEAMANTGFTALKIKLHSVIYDGYKINPNAQYILIKISGNKVKVYS